MGVEMEENAENTGLDESEKNSASDNDDDGDTLEFYSESRSNGMTMFLETIAKQQVEMVSMMIDNGGDIKKRGIHVDKWGVSQQSVLHFAAQGRGKIYAEGNEDLKESEKAISIIQMLVAAGADIEAKNSLGETPLVVACRFGRVSVAKELQSMGASTKVSSQFPPLWGFV